MRDTTLKENVHHGSFMLPMNTYYAALEEGTFDLYLHWHEEMEFIYISSGKGKFTINLKAYEVSEGDLLIIKPEMLHSGTGYKGSPLKCETVVFDLSMLKSFLLDSVMLNYVNPLLDGDFDILNLMKPTEKGYEEIISSLHKVMSCHKQKDFGFELELKALLFHIFAVLFKEEHIIKVPILNSSEDKKIEKLKDILNYIQAHYTEDIPIKKLAEIANFSEYHFIRFFKKHTNLTTRQYINTLRVEKSAQLLLSTSLPITAIAFEAGFENVSYFIKTFKERFGVTPNQFRKQFS